jgi:hypothetical protein
LSATQVQRFLQKRQESIWLVEQRFPALGVRWVGQGSTLTNKRWRKYRVSKKQSWNNRVGGCLVLANRKSETAEQLDFWCQLSKPRADRYINPVKSRVSKRVKIDRFNLKGQKNRKKIA